jgi:hypothetical protein
VTITEHLPCTPALLRLVRLQVVRLLAGATCQPLPTYVIDAVDIQQTSHASSSATQNGICDTSGVENRSGGVIRNPADPANALQPDGNGGFSGTVVATVDTVHWDATLHGCDTSTMPPPACTRQPSGTESFALGFTINIASPVDTTARVDWLIPIAYVSNDMPDATCYFPNAVATYDPVADGHTTVPIANVYSTTAVPFTITESFTRSSAAQGFSTQYTYTITMHAVYPAPAARRPFRTPRRPVPSASASRP